MVIPPVVLTGCSSSTPADQGTSVAGNAMHDAPTNLVKDWPLRTPGNARSETFFLAK